MATGETEETTIERMLARSASRAAKAEGGGGAVMIGA
jgi:hypothetical protein